MSKKLSAQAAANQIDSLIKGGHYRTPKKVIETLPQLAHGLDKYNLLVQSRKPVGSGPALLSR